MLRGSRRLLPFGALVECVEAVGPRVDGLRDRLGGGRLVGAGDVVGEDLCRRPVVVLGHGCSLMGGVHWPVNGSNVWRTDFRPICSPRSMCFSAAFLSV